MDRVELAAQTANADEFIKRLPDQYQTNVGPRGSNFSGGQRQRQELSGVFEMVYFLMLDCQIPFHPLWYSMHRNQ